MAGLVGGRAPGADGPHRDRHRRASVSSPGTHFSDNQAAGQLAREVNDAGAQIVQDHPAHFGLFASLPLRDTDGAPAEIGYAFDTLGADGVIVETSAHGVYPATSGWTLYSPSWRAAGPPSWSTRRPRPAGSRPPWAARGP